MSLNHQFHSNQKDLVSLSSKIWIYTNYDCNLSCAYCLADSHPKKTRQAIELATVERIINEAVEQGFTSVFFTGGEPFILTDIYQMLEYSSLKLPTTVLTNAMLLKGKRLKNLSRINNKNLKIQISLDGSRPEHHDPFRGIGSWKITVDNIKRMKKEGFNISLSTTITSINADSLDEISQFCRSLGVPEQDHTIRPLTKRGKSESGKIVNKTNLIPEMTISSFGVFWHPISTDPDMLVNQEIFPLENSVLQIEEQLQNQKLTIDSELEEFQ